VTRERTTCILYNTDQRKIMGEAVLELFCGPLCDSGVCYPCLKSALIPATKLVLFDVGHGDFMSLFNENAVLVVDCGCINSIHRDIRSIANRIQTRCASAALVISHLHRDHYNFLKYFNNRFFKKIWLPIIPVTHESRRIGEAMLKYLFLSMLSDFLDYSILLPSIFDGFKDRVRFLKKGNTFRWAGTSWEVLWPDLGDPIFAAKVLQKVVPLEERLKNVDDITEKYGFNEIFEQVADRITSILKAGEEEQSAPFYRELSDILNKLDRKLETEDEKRRVREVLKGADKDFQELANWLSLVVRSDTNDFLFLGDAEEEALNQTNPKRFGPFVMTKASHHGTKFASSLVGLETDFLLISRNRHLAHINQGYFSVKTKKNLITKYHGDCILNLLHEPPLSLKVWT
jgi:hypothetical protein